MRSLFISLLLLLSLSSPVLAANTPLTDYNFQLDRYRGNYAQFQVLLKDYQAKPSLNNEQKALLSAKQTLIHRELTMANFYLYLASLIKENSLDHPVVARSLAELTDLTTYHFSQADAANKLLTKEELTGFTTSYLAKVKTFKTAQARSQAINKFAKLYRLQQDLKRAAAALEPSLSNKKALIYVQSGLNQVAEFTSSIDKALDEAASIIDQLNIEEGSLSNTYTKLSENFSSIRASQNQMAEVIIELDENYANQN